MKKGMDYGTFIVTIKHENVIALDSEQFDKNIVENYRNLYWIVAVRNKSYQENFRIADLQKHIALLSQTEQILLKEIYGLEGNETMNLHEINEAYFKGKNMSELKLQIIFLKAIKKLNSIFT